MANGEKKIIEQIRAKIPDALTVVGDFVTDEAKVRCPVLTGNLRGSINPALFSDIATKEMGVRIGTPIEYAPYVEYGTSKQSAQPFLRPAVLDNLDRIDKLFAKALRI